MYFSQTSGHFLEHCWSWIPIGWELLVGSNMARIKTLFPIMPLAGLTVWN